MEQDYHPDNMHRHLLLMTCRIEYWQRYGRVADLNSLIENEEYINPYLDGGDGIAI